MQETCLALVEILLAAPVGGPNCYIIMSHDTGGIRTAARLRI